MDQEIAKNLEAIIIIRIEIKTRKKGMLIGVEINMIVESPTEFSL